MDLTMVCKKVAKDLCTQ